jgi:hypothetical protein
MNEQGGNYCQNNKTSVRHNLRHKSAVAAGDSALTHCTVQTAPHQRAEAEFLDKIQIKVLRVFLLAYHSHLYSFASRFLFLQTHATSYGFCKGERMEIREKTISPSLWFKKSIQKPQV